MEYQLVKWQSYRQLSRVVVAVLGLPNFMNAISSFYFSSSFKCYTDITTFVVKMSFGYSVGDCIAILQLANKVRERFDDAPEQFKVISNEQVLTNSPCNAYRLILLQNDKSFECPSRDRTHAFSASIRRLAGETFSIYSSRMPQRSYCTRQSGRRELSFEYVWYSWLPW